MMVGPRQMSIGLRYVSKTSYSQGSTASVSQSRVVWKDPVKTRYLRESILRSEFVYGHGFQGPGGLESTEKYAATLSLQPGMSGVDVGCGPGGATFHMADKYGVNMVGLDNQAAMVDLCNDRLAEVGTRGAGGSVKFTCGSCADRGLLPLGSQDLVWSRDVMVYLADKEEAYSVWKDWLKPGGQVFVTDYGISANPSQQYLDYNASANHHCVTLEAATEAMRHAGFEDVFSEDISADFGKLYEKDLARFRARRGEFVASWGDEHFEPLESRWRTKLASIKDGSMRWLLLRGKKPSN